MRMHGIPQINPRVVCPALRRLRLALGLLTGGGEETLEQGRVDGPPAPVGRRRY